MDSGKNNISAQISLYPLGQKDYREKIKNILPEFRKTEEVQVKVGEMATFVSGSEEKVWDLLQRIYKAADSEGEFSLIITLSNACGKKEEGGKAGGS